MLTALRRMFWLALIGGVGYAVYAAVERRGPSDVPDAPVWPPIPTPEPASTAPANSAPMTAPPIAATDSTWVAPEDGSCPTSHPLKANANSNIYHQPGGRFYDRTAADRCYADTDAAEADGYRAAKS